MSTIRCVGCKSDLNTFYLVNGRCPLCGFVFSSAKQVISNTGLRQLKKDKKQYLQDTISKAQAKSMFKLTEKQIIQIPVAREFGLIRYKKIDVVKVIHKAS